MGEIFFKKNKKRRRRRRRTTTRRETSSSAREDPCVSCCVRVVERERDETRETRRSKAFVFVVALF